MEVKRGSYIWVDGWLFGGQKGGSEQRNSCAISSGRLRMNYHVDGPNDGTNGTESAW